MDANRKASLIRAIERRRTSRTAIGPADASDEGRGRTALVTGASAGIGRAMAELLAAKGHDVIVVARREERLKLLQDELQVRWGVQVHPLVCDLSASDAAQRVRDQLAERGLTVDVLVANAGFDLIALYNDIPWEEHLRSVRLLATGVAELCYYLLPHMVEQQWGRVIIIGSLAGLMKGTPGQVLYAANKSFVYQLSEGLAAEHRNDGITFTYGAVGATDTEVQDASGFGEWKQSVVHQLWMMSPEDVSRKTYAACMKGKRVVAAGWHNTGIAFLLQHSVIVGRGVSNSLANTTVTAMSKTLDSPA